MTRTLRSTHGPGTLILAAVLLGSYGCGPTDSATPEEARDPRSFAATAVVEAEPDASQVLPTREGHRLRIRTVLGGSEVPSPHTAFRIRQAGPRAGSASNRPSEFEGVTDGSGLAEVSVEEWMTRNGRFPIWPRFAAEIDEPGQRRTRVSRFTSTGDPTLREVTLRSVPGHTLRGIVLDGDRTALEARVEAWTATDPPVFLGEAESFAGSGFELHLGGEFIDACIVARHPRLGAAVSRVRWNAAEDMDSLEMIVSGRARLRGRIVDQSGSAVRRTEVVAVHEDVLAKDVGDASPVLTAHGLRLLAEGLGRIRHRVAVDPRGLFEFKGLRPGRYFVYAITPAAANLMQPLAAEPLAADGSQAPHVVLNPRIIVQVQGADGGSYSGPIGVHPNRRKRTRGWPRDLGVAAFEILEAGMGPADSTLLKGWKKPDGTLEFAPRGGRKFRVGFVGAGIPWRPRVVSLPEDGSDARITLRVPEPEPEGILEVTVDGPGGEPMEMFEVGIQFLDPDQGTALVEASYFDGLGPGWPRRFTLPAGDWCVEATHLMYQDPYCLDDMLPTVMAQATIRTVSVVAGATVEVRIELEEGGSLVLDLQGSPTGPRRSVEFRDRGIHSIFGSDLRVDMGDAWAVLEREGDRPRPLTFFRADSIHGERTLHDVAVSTFGSRVRTARFPAGDYVLKCQTFDGRVQRLPVSLVDGAATTVVVDFP